MADSTVQNFLKKRHKENAQNALNYIDIIVSMIKSGEYKHSEDFLLSVLKYIESSMSISKKQMSVIDKIKK